MSRRILIVFDGAAWFIRGVASTTHDVTDGRDEKVYRCDEHVGGPFATLDEAVAAFKASAIMLPSV
jgi:hypothetical protein